MASMLDFDDFAASFHFVTFSVMIFVVAYYAKQEYQNAVESWIQASENMKNEDDEDSTAWEAEDENSRKVFSVGELVVHPDLGKGRIIETNMGNSPYITVDFDILNDFRQLKVTDVLWLSMRLRHQSRGLGSIVLFNDADERAHVQFDSGDYHRYQYTSWKKKMVVQTRALTNSRKLKKTFKSFFRDYILYRTDYMLSTFSTAKPMVLFLGTYTLIIVGASAYSLVSGKPTSEAIWIAWTMVADPGTHVDEEGSFQRLVALMLTLGGMLVFALMIGIIAEGVSSLLDDLKQGHSYVIETGHTLILGWSDKTLPFVREICLANESEGGGVIVILADLPKVTMETELQLSPEESKNSLVICRSGNPTMQTDLRKVSAGSARSVVILADHSLEPDESDARAVRCILSLQGIRKSKMGHIVVEMCDVDNRDLGLLADSRNVEVVVAHDLIGRLMIQCAREPGLAQILDELLGFEGDEFYLKTAEELDGVTFGEVLFRFEDAIPVGVKPANRTDAWGQLQSSEWLRESLIRRDWDGSLRSDLPTPEVVPVSLSRDQPEIIDHFSLGGREEDDEECLSRKVILNPPNDYVMRPGDELVVLAQDDDTYESKALHKMPKNAVKSFEGMLPAHRPICHTRPEKFLFCGWRRDMDDMILELDQLVGKGSEVTLMCVVPVEERDERFEQGGLDVNKLKNISLHHVVGNPFLRRDLNRIKNQLCQFGSVLILADQSLETNIPSADSRSLASLLLIRDMISKMLQAKAVMNTPGTSSKRFSVDKPAPLETQWSFSEKGWEEKKFLRSWGSSFGSEGSFRTNATEPERIASPEAPVAPAMGSPGSSHSEGSTERQIVRKASRSSFLKESFAGSRRDLLLEQQGNSAKNLGTSSPSLLRMGDTFVRRLSAVGAALFFENAHQTGNTVLISEILDSRTKALIPVANVGDHVMSNEIVAAVLAMVSECRDINVILSELLQADGNELHLRSALDYGRLGEKIDFWMLQARARARGEICIGYRNVGERNANLNPREKCAKFTLNPKSMVVVIAED